MILNSAGAVAAAASGVAAANAATSRGGSSVTSARRILKNDTADDFSQFAGMMAHDAAGCFQQIGSIKPAVFPPAVTVVDLNELRLLIAVTRQQVLGGLYGVVDDPVHFSLDDWPHFTSSFDPYRVGLSAPSKVFEIWAEEFNYMRAHAPGGVLTLTMHPQVIGRGHRVAMLQRLIEFILADGDVRFARLIDVAQAMEGGE